LEKRKLVKYVDHAMEFSNIEKLEEELLINNSLSK
jgi:hypothetical protein